jgi:hypothetical protein
MTILYPSAVNRVIDSQIILPGERPRDGAQG